MDGGQWRSLPVYDVASGLTPQHLGRKMNGLLPQNEWLVSQVHSQW